MSLRDAHVGRRDRGRDSTARAQAAAAAAAAASVSAIASNAESTAVAAQSTALGVESIATAAQTTADDVQRPLRHMVRPMTMQGVDVDINTPNTAVDLSQVVDGATSVESVTVTHTVTLSQFHIATKFFLMLGDPGASTAPVENHALNITPATHGDVYLAIGDQVNIAGTDYYVRYKSRYNDSYAVALTPGGSPVEFANGTATATWTKLRDVGPLYNHVLLNSGEVAFDAETGINARKMHALNKSTFTHYYDTNIQDFLTYLIPEAYAPTGGPVYVSGRAEVDGKELVEGIHYEQPPIDLGRNLITINGVRHRSFKLKKTVGMMTKDRWTVTHYYTGVILVVGNS